MCGFLVATTEAMVAYADRDYTPRGASAGVFRGLLDTLENRGPDGSGVFADDDVVMGHRRLAILDLEHGAQPMEDKSGRYELAYNGELYNFIELRGELEGLGHVFETRCDTEVMLGALMEWGVEGLGKLNGMFAFALWDRRERTLLVGRDRVGIKPLFVSLEGERLVVASTLAPFWGMKGFPRKASMSAIRDYLAQLFIGPGDTILEAVKPVAPGSWLRYHAADGRVERGQYWDLPEATANPMGFEELVDATDEALKDAVRRQMIADKPLGVFFSGGIDSSLLTHYMREGSNQTIQTFTVKFDQSRKHDEAPIANTVAKALGTEHHELTASEISEGDFRGAVGRMDQPFGDSSYLPVMSLAKLAKPYITVAIGGDGGDEVFGGYPRYRKDVGHYPDNVFHRVVRGVTERGLLPSSVYRPVMRGEAHVMRAFSRMGDYPITTRSLRSILTADAIEQMKPEGVMEDWLKLAKRWSGKLDADSLKRADLWYYLSLNGLVKTDRATMACSMEARVPLLDNAVLDLALKQPADVHMRGGLKSVLMELAKRHLPDEVWDRPKRGFTVPERHYLLDNWSSYTHHLVSECGRLAPFLDSDEVQRRWGMMVAGRKVDWPMYGVIVLLGWLETHPLDWG